MGHSSKALLVIDGIARDRLCSKASNMLNQIIARMMNNILLRMWCTPQCWGRSGGGWDGVLCEHVCACARAR
eukprot:1149778-Pelagomonas_calceolata.AAC.2